MLRAEGMDGKLSSESGKGRKLEFNVEYMGLRLTVFARQFRWEFLLFLNVKTIGVPANMEKLDLYTVPRRLLCGNEYLRMIHLS